MKGTNNHLKLAVKSNSSRLILKVKEYNEVRCDQRKTLDQASMMIMARVESWKHWNPTQKNY